MSGLRTKVPAAILTIALVGGALGVPLAAAAELEQCAGWHQDCGMTMAVAPCCDRVNPSTVAASADTSVAGPGPAIAITRDSTPFNASNGEEHTGPRFGSPPDLPTLYASLLN